MSEELKPCEYCGTALPVGIDKKTRQMRSYHFARCEKRPQPEPAAPTALQRFNECDGDTETDPLERLRFFCSLAMRGQDWLDVEPFFDAVKAAAPTVVEPEPVAHCALTPSGKIANFDGKPMMMVGSVGNEHHPHPLYLAAHPPRAALTSESMEALRELVACEDMRLEVQSIRSDPYYITEADAMELKYEQRRDKAWDRARAVIAASGEPK